MADYQENTVEELKDMAHDRGIVGYSDMNKDDLIATLEADDRNELPVEDPETGELVSESIVQPVDPELGGQSFEYGQQMSDEEREKENLKHVEPATNDEFTYGNDVQE